MRAVALAAILFPLLHSFGAASERGRSQGPKNGIKTPGIQIPAANLKAEAEFPTDGAPTGIAFADKVYLAVRDSGSLIPVITKTSKAEEALPAAKDLCGGIVSAFRGLWVATCTDGKVAKFDAKAKKLTTTITTTVADLPRAIAASSDSLWVLSDALTTLSRLDPEAGSVVAQTRLEAGCNSILFSQNTIWVTCPGNNKLLKINTLTNLVEERVEVEGEPVAVTFGEGSLWVLTRKEGKLVRLDAKTLKPSATVELKVPGAMGTLAFGEGAVWVSTPEFPVMRVDPASDKVAQQFAGDGGGNIYIGAGSIWLADKEAKVVRRYDPKRIRATLAE